MFADNTAIFKSKITVLSTLRGGNIIISLFYII